MSLLEFLHFREHVVYFIRHNVNDMHSILQVFIQFYANIRTFGGFLHDMPGLLRSAIGAQWGAGGDFAACFRLNRAEPGTLSPRGCCGVL